MQIGTGRCTGYAASMSQRQGCLGQLLSLFGGDTRERAGPAGRPKPVAMPPVTINKKFISFAESSFFRVLQQAIGDQGHLLAEVALNRLLWLPESWWNKIQYETV